MHVHLARRLVVDCNTDRAHFHRRIANRQSAGGRQAGEFDPLAGLDQTDESSSRGRTIGHPGSPTDTRRGFGLEGLCKARTGQERNSDCGSESVRSHVPGHPKDSMSLVPMRKAFGWMSHPLPLARLDIGLPYYLIGTVVLAVLYPSSLTQRGSAPFQTTPRISTVSPG
jgi:hypothetical protein